MAGGPQHVVEGVGNADGNHQALFELSSHRGQPPTDGAVWGTTLDRSVYRGAVTMSDYELMSFNW